MICRSIFPVIFALLCAVRATAEDQSFSSNGVRVRYMVEGQGTPVILVHGFASDVERQWKGLLKPLSERYRVIAIDCRGHGKSDKPTDPAKYGPEMVEDISRLMDYLTLKQVHLVGYSMGASISAQFALKYPERLLTLTLGGSSGFPKGEAFDGFIQSLSGSLDKGSFGVLAAGLAGAGSTPERLKEVEGKLAEGNDLKALAAVVRGWSALGIDRAELAKLKIPVLGIVGGKDGAKAGLEALAKVIPNYSLVVVGEESHGRASWHPDFAKGVIEFLGKQRE